MAYRLHLGDAAEDLPQLPEAGSVQLIVTSPPYNVGWDYGPEISDDRSLPEYLEYADEQLQNAPLTDLEQSA